MFQIDKLIPEYKNLIGWKQYFKPDDIKIDDDLLNSETGEYYQSKTGALRLDYIQSTLNEKQNLSQYLRDSVINGIGGIFNDIIQYRQLSNYGKTLLEQTQLLNRPAWNKDTVTNKGRFVGFQVAVRNMTGLIAVINQIGLQLDGTQDVEIYVFHSDLEDPIKQFTIKSNNGGWSWNKSDLDLSAFEIAKHNAGVFVIGYYQDDLIFNAINYSNFDWNKGECGSCNNSYHASWKSIRNNYHIYPMYVSAGNYEKGKMFPLENVEYSKDVSFGLNLMLSVKCDLTDFFITNKFAFKNLLMLKVSSLILNDMKYSSEINAIVENLQSLVIRELEGDKETYYANIPTQYNRELKAVTFNISDINIKCLNGPQSAFEPTFSVL